MKFGLRGPSAGVATGVSDLWHQTGAGGPIAQLDAAFNTNADAAIGGGAAGRVPLLGARRALRQTTAAPAPAAAPAKSGGFDTSSAAGAAAGGGAASAAGGMMGTINKYKEQALEVKKKAEKQMPIKQKEMKAIGAKYTKIMKEKAKQLQEDAGKFKADFEQLKGAIGIVQKIVQDMQVPGAMDAVQEEVKNNIIEEAKAKGAPPEIDEAKLMSEAKKFFMKKYEADVLKAFPKMGKALMNADTDEDRNDIMEDAMEARLNKLQTEFNKQTELLQKELTVLKNDLLVELSKQMDDVFDILDDLPVIGEKIRQEGEKIWLKAKEKIKEEEVPEIPDPIEMIKNLMQGGGAGGIIDIIKEKLGMGAKKSPKVAPGDEGEGGGEGEKKKKKKKKKDAE